MKLDKRGFAVTSIIYSMLVLFLALLLLITSNLASRKVLFDKEKNEILDKLNGLNLCELVDGNDTDGSVTVGDKYSCNFGGGNRNFYVLETWSNPVSNSTLKENEVTLILEGNYDMETLAGCASGNDNACAADGLEAKLDDIVENAWTKLDRSQIGIPSAEQIMAADEREEDAYLSGDLTLSKEWLYSYPEYAEWSEGMNPPYGYWTSTPHAVYSCCAWIVPYGGDVTDDCVEFDTDFGARPVITLSIDELVR